MSGSVGVMALRRFPGIFWLLHSEGIGYSVIGGKEWRSHPGSVGRPRGGEVHILDQAGNELPPGQTGTLWFSAAGRGPLPDRISYCNDPTANATLHSDRGWDSPGDLGCDREAKYT